MRGRREEGEERERETRTSSFFAVHGGSPTYALTGLSTGSIFTSCVVCGFTGVA
jgi:hypothetical protein